MSELTRRSGGGGGHGAPSGPAPDPRGMNAKRAAVPASVGEASIGTCGMALYGVWSSREEGCSDAALHMRRIRKTLGNIDSDGPPRRTPGGTGCSASWSGGPDTSRRPQAGRSSKRPRYRSTEISPQAGWSRAAGWVAIQANSTYRRQLCNAIRNVRSSIDGIHDMPIIERTVLAAAHRYQEETFTVASPRSWERLTHAVAVLIVLFEVVRRAQVGLEDPQWPPSVLDHTMPLVEGMCWANSEGGRHRAVFRNLSPGELRRILGEALTPTSDGPLVVEALSTAKKAFTLLYGADAWRQVVRYAALECDA